MNLFISTFQAVAVMFLVGGLGIYIISRKIVPSNALKMLSPLAIDIALPCLASYNVLTKFKPETLGLWWMMPIYWAGFTVIAFILSIIFMNISQKIYRREFFTSLFYQNGIFFPLTIIGGMFGLSSIHLVHLFLFTLFFPAFFHNTMPIVYRGHSMDGHNKSWLLNPVFVATIFSLAIVISGLNRYVPNFIINGLQMVGGMSLPVLLLIIGANVYLEYQKTRGDAPIKIKIERFEIVKFLVIKNIIFPAFILLILKTVNLPHDIAFLIMLQASVPPITIAPIITERFGGNSSIVNQFLLSSFLFSLISIPIAVTLFDIFI